MALSYFPTWPVDGPPPIPPRVGLVPAAEAEADGVRIVTDTDQRLAQITGAEGLVPAGAGTERWINGVKVYPYPGDLPETWNACLGASAGEKSFGDAVPNPEFAAFTIDVPITCTTSQVPDQAAFKARAEMVLNATQSYAMARQLMNGEAVEAQPYLADGNGVFPNGDMAVKPNYGLQLLEEQIALSGRMGLIHCSPMLTTALMGSGMALRDDTGVIRTINQNVVIPDYGYAAGSTPIGHTAPDTTEEWAYATGPVDIRRSAQFTMPGTLAEALDRGMGATNDMPNSITYRAEMYALVLWDTIVQAAVLIDRCSNECNPAS